MKAYQLVSSGPEDTIAFGAQLATQLKAGDILCLSGDLGSGKTTLVKGLAKGLKIDADKVHSPTFVLMNVYEGRLPIFHFDLYRIEDHAEILRLDYEDYFYDDGVSVVEWAERLGELLPPDRLEIRLSHQGEDRRLIELSARGERSLRLLEKVQ